MVAGYGRSYSDAMLADAFGSRDGIAANPPVRLVRYIQSNGIRHILRNPEHPAAIGKGTRWPAPTAGSQGKTYPTLIG